MKSLVSLLVLSSFVGFASRPAPSAPVPSRPVAGGWTTGAVGTLGDVVYGPGQHVIDLATTGLYDPAQWVVILDYNTLTVQSGATVTFTNHPSRAPVVIRAVGDIIIDGTIRVDGGAGHEDDELPYLHSEPGPGAFRGATAEYLPSYTAGAGFGPGGGFLAPGPWPDSFGGNGSYATQGTNHPQLGQPGPSYGSPAVQPLIGGSGGAGGNLPLALPVNSGGGAGGGAILVGSDLRIALSGSISARGGASGAYSGSGGYGGQGSGGAIRLVAPTIVQTGPNESLDARGGEIASGTEGGLGRIRIETDGAAGQMFLGIPAPSVSTTLNVFLPSLPAVTLQSWWHDALSEWVPIDQDPYAVIVPPSAADVQIPVPGLRTVRLEGRDVPLGASLHVRITLARGEAVIDSTHTMGESTGPNGEASTLSQSWTEVPIDFSHGVTAVQVRAELP